MNTWQKQSWLALSRRYLAWQIQPTQQSLLIIVTHPSIAIYTISPNSSCYSIEYYKKNSREKYKATTCKLEITGNELQHLRIW